MTFLEAIIVRLTRETCNGGTCQIGDVTLVVRYCSDIWEWDYLGETYWDVEGLAEAIIRDGRAIPEKVAKRSPWSPSLNYDHQGQDALGTRLQA